MQNPVYPHLGVRLKIVGGHERAQFRATRCRVNGARHGDLHRAVSSRGRGEVTFIHARRLVCAVDALVIRAFVLPPGLAQVEGRAAHEPVMAVYAPGLDHPAMLIKRQLLESIADQERVGTVLCGQRAARRQRRWRGGQGNAFHGEV